MACTLTTFRCLQVRLQTKVCVLLFGTAPYPFCALSLEVRILAYTMAGHSLENVYLAYLGP